MRADVYFDGPNGSMAPKFRVSYSRGGALDASPSQHPRCGAFRHEQGTQKLYLVPGICWIFFIGKDLASFFVQTDFRYTDYTHGVALVAYTCYYARCIANRTK